MVGAVPGGAIGGYIAPKRDPGFSTDQSKEMAESLEPDHSMVVMVTDVASAAEVERILFTIILLMQLQEEGMLLLEDELLDRQEDNKL